MDLSEKKGHSSGRRGSLHHACSNFTSGVQPEAVTMLSAENDHSLGAPSDRMSLTNPTTSPSRERRDLAETPIRRMDLATNKLPFAGRRDSKLPFAGRRDSWPTTCSIFQSGEQINVSRMPIAKNDNLLDAFSDRMGLSKIKTSDSELAELFAHAIEAMNHSVEVRHSGLDIGLNFSTSDQTRSHTTQIGTNQHPEHSKQSQSIKPKQITKMASIDGNNSLGNALPSRRTNMGRKSRTRTYTPSYRWLFVEKGEECNTRTTKNQRRRGKDGY